jgi:hypothetical protein
MNKTNTTTKFISGIISFILLFWLNNLFSHIIDKLNQYLIGKSSPAILKLFFIIPLILLTRIPVYLILLFFVIGWIIYFVVHTFIFKSPNLIITRALYGSGTIWSDITNQLNDFIVDNQLVIPLTNSILGRDPVPHATKLGKITYLLGKKTYTKKYIEGQIVKLP